MNFKIYRNVAATLGTRDWWKGVFGNILSTIIGILLTIGIGALVEYHHEKRLAREAMFSIIKICDDNEKVLEIYDSTYQAQIEFTQKIYDIYHATNKFKDLNDQKQADSIQQWIQIFQPIMENRDTHADRYFNSAQMMHQIGNAAVYSQFARFVELDRETFDKIDALNIQEQILLKKLNTKIYFDQVKGGQPIVDIIEDHTVSDYILNIALASLPVEVQLYKIMHQRLLTAMDATEEEYQDYVEANTTELKPMTITNADVEKEKKAKEKEKAKAKNPNKPQTSKTK